MSNQKIHVCPYCGSAEVFTFRQNSQNDGYQFDEVNPEHIYSRSLAEYCNFDLTVGYCASCKSVFDPAKSPDMVEVITVADLEGRIANVKATLKRKENDRQCKCASIRTNVSRSLDDEMARNSRLFDELKAINVEIAKLRELIDTLEHIRQSDRTYILAPASDT